MAWVRTIKFLFSNKYFKVGVIILLPLVLLGALGPLLFPGSIDMMLYPRWQPPSNEHYLGTDGEGRDIFTVLLHSIGQSLLIGVIAGGLAFLLGLTAGLITGYKRGIVSDVIVNVANVFLVLPTLPILMLVASYVFSMTVPMLAAIIAALDWAWLSRTIRSQTMTLKEREFVNLAKVSGVSDIKIVFMEIVPNMLSFLAVTLVIEISWAMATEVGLEIIGIRAQGTSTLGIMIYWALRSGALLIGTWWWIIPPVLCLILAFIGLQFIVMGLDAVFNPRLRGRI